MRAVAVDDNEKMHKILKQTLELIDADIQLEGTAATVAQGVSLIKKVNPDVVFLDIQLPDGDGFDILELIDHEDYLIIFISSHDEFGRRALAFEALDYLDKPLHPKDLKIALEKAKRRFKQRTKAERAEGNEIALDNYRQEKLPTRLTVSNTEGFHVVPLSEIMYLETSDSLITIITEQGEKICKAGRLRRFTEFFDAYEDFMLVRQSIIVNLRKVRKMIANQYLELTNGEKIRFTAKLAAEIKERLERLL